MAGRALSISGLLYCLCWVITAQELPNIILGTFQDVPSQSDNYDQFANLFDLPSDVNLHNLHQIQFRKEGNQYYHKFIFWRMDQTVIDVPFQLNKTVLFPVTGRGKTIECVYNVEETSDKLGATLKVQFRHVEGTMKYSVEAVFDRKGIHSKLERDGVVAKRVYRRTLPPYAIGNFEVDPTSLTPDVIAFYHTLAPLPEGIKIGNISFYFGPQFQSDVFLDQIIYDPTFSHTTEFKFFEKFSASYGNTTYEMEYVIEESNSETTKVVATIPSTDGQSVKWTTIFNRNGSGIEIAWDEESNKEFTVRFNHVLPWGLLGLFEQDPSWNGTTPAPGENRPMGKLAVTRKGRQYTFTEHVGDKVTTFPAELTGLEQSGQFGAKTIKYNVSTDFGPWHMAKLTGEKHAVTLMPTPKGIVATVKSENSTIKKVYARVMALPVFGVFESDQHGEDFTQFLQATEYVLLL